MKRPSSKTVSQFGIAVGVLIGGCAVFAPPLGIAGALIAAGSGWAFYRISERDYKPLTREEVQQMLEDFRDRESPSPPLRESERFPGFSHHMVISLQRSRAAGRKFIMDYGEKNSNRLSLYLDKSDYLCFRVIDGDGEPHVLKVPAGSSSWLFGKFLYLAVEVGRRANSSFLRVLVDGVEVMRSDLPFPLDFQPIEISGGVVGANLDGKDGGAFQLVEVCSYSKTLDDENLANMLEYFKSRPVVKTLVFSVKDWMKIGPPEKRDLTQPNPRYQPLVRSYELSPKRVAVDPAAEDG